MVVCPATTQQKSVKEETTMKKLYTSPMVTVEDLTKADVLCASTETNTTPPGSTSNPTDSINQTATTLGNMTRFL